MIERCGTDMLDSNSAALDQYMRDTDAAEERRERLEKLCPDDDLKLDILDSIFEVGDKWDWCGFVTEHPAQSALSMLAVAVARPDTKPRDWDDVRVILTGTVRDVLDDFVRDRLPQARKKWIEKEWNL